ncbi:metallophosphoesterase [Streptomyces sp. ISL-99]|uniref:metallophosphoesterase n=1 Tax=Streptomyces sp. ISL-99 TaxID=2819193 RepID=UPI001BE5DFBB|nr:metallophosphoesterase [Streptomyces sp. ISL-99]MBT2523924.1 metallophosphoesterase [Streptomyces sp. ISL-99]
MVVVFVFIALSVIALLAGAHWYVWRRLVRDTTAGGSVLRRAGTVAAVLLPLLAVGALVSARAGTPFWAQQVLAWPGYMWLAVLMYLVMALVVGEAVRPVLRWWLGRRDAEEATGVSPLASALPPASADGSAASGPRTPRTRGGAGTSTAPAAGGTDTVTEPEAPAPPAPAPAAPIPGTRPGGSTASGDLSRRMFVSRVVGAGAAVAALGTVGYGTYGVLRGPRVKRVSVPLAKLPRGAHGFRVAVVSDVHLGPILGRAHTQRIVDRINSVQPDLVAVVGDLVDGSVADLGHAAEPLAQIRARHGAFFVTGNHEYFSGAEQWVDHVRELGLRPLENDRVEIAGFDLAGVNDLAGESEGQGPDFVRALGDRDRTRAAVLLAHQPVVIHDAVRHGVDLQLSGHTHGGQLWPGNFLAAQANPTVAGLERYGDTQLYVSRGAGAWGPPVRVGAESDITVVELASRQA